MKSWKKPTNEMIDRALKLVKKETSRRYFFSRLKNPLWIQPLAERGYFQSPPRIRRFDDGYVQFPSWPEIQYLKNVSRDVPDEVIEIVLQLPKVDNPSVYNDILEIALQLHGEQSVKLKPKIFESTDIDHQSLAHRYADLLAHWTAESQTSAALELAEMLVEFVPDPQFETKQKRRRENPADPSTLWETSLEPSPRITPRAYRKIMSTGVRPLAEKEPYRVARLLTNATTNMIRLQMHQEDMDQEEDYSEAWCKRLHELDRKHEGHKATLVHTLTFACEQVYEKSPDSVVPLDNVLRDQQWKIFKRLRQHLYAQFPNEQTKSWIRDLILTHEEYHLWEHRYEFQQMIRGACDHFGESLLTEAERKQIFDAICSGPSKANHQAWVVGWLGEEFTKEGFQQRQRDFNRKQFRPFAPLLFGEYATYFQELETVPNNPISDEDYPPLITRGGYVSNRSPYSPEDLANLADKELLTTINEWEGKELFAKDDLFIEIDIEGFAKAFRTVFTKTIIPNANRLRFWLENRERIERPIYVRMMINGIQTDVREKNFDNLSEWLRFSEWVLSHPDQVHEGNYRGDESRENSNWYSSRRAVGDFIEVCLDEEVNVPVFARGQLVQLLKMLCTQFDSWLDLTKRVFSNRDNPISEGVNNSRSRALEALVRFGFWLRRYDSESRAPEVTTILEKRFAPEAKPPLMLPEYAILGKNYNQISSLNEAWAAEHKSDFFPQNKLPEWLAAFSSFICYNGPFKPAFKILRDDFDFALQHLANFKKQDHPGEEWIDIFGQHLFRYYLWEMYPLSKSARNNNRCSLLEQFYQQTADNIEHWAALFDYVGHILWNTNEQMAKDLKDRIVGFFDWRFEVKEPTELQQFTYWLEAECLEAEWRLEAYSKILEVCKSDDVSINIQVEALCKMLPDYTAEVLECFVKLTDGIKDNNIYILAEEAKTILKAGFKSTDENVCRNAAQARENLLRAGRFDLLNLDD